MTASYRFLRDHFIGGTYIAAGDVASDADVLPSGWVPSANVDPLTDDAVQQFYDAGPQLTGVIRTQWQAAPMYAPATYWYETTPNWWGLTGLGSDQTQYPPRLAFIGRIE